MALRGLPNRSTDVYLLKISLAFFDFSFFFFVSFSCLGLFFFTSQVSPTVSFDAVCVCNCVCLNDDESRLRQQQQQQPVVRCPIRATFLFCCFFLLFLIPADNLSLIQSSFLLLGDRAVWKNGLRFFVFYFDVLIVHKRKISKKTWTRFIQDGFPKVCARNSSRFLLFWISSHFVVVVVFGIVVLPVLMCWKMSVVIRMFLICCCCFRLVRFRGMLSAENLTATILPTTKRKLLKADHLQGDLEEDEDDVELPPASPPRFDYIADPFSSCSRSESSTPLNSKTDLRSRDKPSNHGEWSFLFIFFGFRYWINRSRLSFFSSCFSLFLFSRIPKHVNTNHIERDESPTRRHSLTVLPPLTRTLSNPFLKRQSLNCHLSSYTRSNPDPRITLHPAHLSGKSLFLSTRFRPVSFVPVQQDDLETSWMAMSNVRKRSKTNEIKKLVGCRNIIHRVDLYMENQVSLDHCPVRVRHRLPLHRLRFIRHPVHRCTATCKRISFVRKNFNKSCRASWSPWKSWFTWDASWLPLRSTTCHSTRPSKMTSSMERCVPSKIKERAFAWRILMNYMIHSNISVWFLLFLFFCAFHF